jgi:hypothetical protein
MNSIRIGTSLLFAAACLMGSAPPQRQRYYVDASAGDDANDGLSPEKPWKSLRKVNASPLQPGDAVLFRRRQSWRGQLVPCSGSDQGAVTYGAYGKGDKPLLLGSVSRSAPEDWRSEGGNVWATAEVRYTQEGAVADLAQSRWSLHSEGGARVETSQAEGAHQIRGSAGGTQPNHIQFSATGFPVKEGRFYGVTFRARCTKEFSIPSLSLMKTGPPWTSYGTPSFDSRTVGPEWRDYSVRFKSTATAADARLTLFLGGGFPADATFSFAPGKFSELRCNQEETLDADVGNVIFDHGAATGVKKWKTSDLQRPGDYHYDPRTWQVRLFCETNPARRHKSLELALSRHIISEGNRSHVTYSNLALRYGAAHGIGGGTTHHITVRDCDLSYLGGGHQLTRPDGKPVRYGNGIEFWDGARDNLVERCRIWEIYDAALTNQGSGPGNTQANITWRQNAIWNSEYSFEYWNRDQTSRTENVVFEHNTCVGAGRGWGHAQRPDPNGRHVMFYLNSARTTGVRVRENIFCDATESLLRLEPPDWTAGGLEMDRNCWWQPGGKVIQWLRESWGADRFADYQAKTGQDAHSIVADPRFADAAKLDFRPSPGSPAAAGPGGALGATEPQRED